MTGGSGFIGQHLCCSLAKSGYDVIAATRSAREHMQSGNYDLATVGDLTSRVDWDPLLQNVDCVVHLAARVHVMEESASDPLQEFRLINVTGTQRLAERAAANGVRKFIYLSSIKVNGEKTDATPFTHSDRPAPLDPYGVSKMEAEEALDRIAAKSDLRCVILRPPLVYGPGVRGNMLRVMQLVSKKIPLPLSLIRNKRSMLAVSNLCSAIQTCLEHPSAAGNKFLVADSEDLSTPDLFRLIANAMNISASMFPVPESVLRLGGFLLRRSDEVSRLCDSLQVDTSHIRDTLNWKPTTTVSDAMHLQCQSFLESERK